MKLLDRESMTKFCDGIRFIDNDGTSNLDNAAWYIQQEAASIGIPIAMSKEQMRYGSAIVDVVNIFNTEHPNDYAKHVIMFTKTGKICRLEFFYYGASKLTRRQNIVDSISKNKRLNSSLLGAVAGSVIGRAGKVDQFALDQEYDYYAALQKIFEEMGQ